MFDNPLYGSMMKSQSRNRDQDHSHREHLTPPDLTFTASKADVEGERPPVPTPRNRSFTCSEGKPQPPAPTAAHPSMNKKPVVPSRSEGAMSHGKPPLPIKSQNPKPREYRDNLELPLKRLPARPGQPSTHRDGKENPDRSSALNHPNCSLKSSTINEANFPSPGHPEVPKRGVL